MDDTTVRKSPRKKRKNTKLSGFYLTEKGQTVLMSAADGISFNTSDNDGQLTIKATTKRRILSSDEDTIENEEHDKENGPEDPDDGPNLDWHILPTKGETEDTTDVYTGTKRSTINILAEVHSASPPGYVSPKDPARNDMGSPNNHSLSPITSPSKNGCVVSREDRIICHKRLYQGSPTRKSKRIGRETFKKPADPPQQVSDDTVQASTCLAESSVADSPVSEPSVSPACRNVEEELNKGPLLNENRNDAAKVETSHGKEVEHRSYTQLKKVYGTAQNDMLEDEGPMSYVADDAASVVSVASSSTTITLTDDVQKEQDVESVVSCDAAVAFTDDVEKDQGVGGINEAGDGKNFSCGQAGDSNAGNDGMKYQDTQRESDEIVPVGPETEGVEIVSEVTNEDGAPPREAPDESDILDAIMDSSFPPVDSTNAKKSSLIDSDPISHASTELNCKAKKSELTSHVNVAVGQNPATSTEVCHNPLNASLNTSTEEFVSADEMPVDDEPLHDDIVDITESQHEEIMQGASSLDSPPCTPPMSPTKKENQLEEMRRSLTKDCKVMLKKTPTPPRYLAKLNSEKSGTWERCHPKRSDLDDSFHTASSGEEGKTKTAERSERRKSQRRRSIKSLSQIMDEDDSDSDCPVVQRKCYMTQFQKFLQLTKDLDDTPSDKGTPPTRTGEIFQDSPATLLSRQLDEFTLSTPVAKLPLEKKDGKETSKRSRKIAKKVDRSPSPSPEKRKHLTKSSKIKAKTPEKGARLPTKIKKEPSSPPKANVRTPERKKITPSAITPLTPLVNLAKESDVSAIQEYLSPSKLKVNVSTPAKEMKIHCSPNRLHIDVSMRTKEIEKHSSPLRVKLTQPNLAEHLSPVRVQIRSPPATILEQISFPEESSVSQLPQEKAISHSENVYEDNEKEVIVLEELNVEGKAKATMPATERKGRSKSRRRSTQLVPQRYASNTDEDQETVPESSSTVVGSKKQTDERDKLDGMAKEIEELENEIQQVTLHSTKKKRKTKRSLGSEPADEATNDHASEMESSETTAGELQHTGKLLSDFDMFPFDDDDDERPAPSKRAKKAKPPARRRSTRLQQRQNTDSWETESVVSRCYSEPPAERTRVMPSRRSKAASYAGSIGDSDVDSLASLDSWQSDTVFGDLDPFSDEAPKKRTGRRKSLRIAKRKSLQLGNFDALDRNDGNKSVGLTEEEVRRLNNRHIPGTKKRTRSSSRSARDDASEVTSVVSFASDSDIVFCGVFKSPGPSTTTTTTEPERTEDEQKLWDDFVLGFDTSVKNPKKAKKKSAKPSRRMSARLHGGCSSFLELTMKGEPQEVSSQEEWIDTDREDAESEATDVHCVWSAAEDEHVPAKTSRRQRKESEQCESVTSEVSHISDIAKDVEEVDNEIEDAVSEASTAKKERHKKKSKAKSRRRSSRAFKPVHLEEPETCVTELRTVDRPVVEDHDCVEKMSDIVAEDVDDIANSLTVDRLPSEADVCDTESKQKRDKKTAKKRRRSSALFKPPKITDKDVLLEEPLVTDDIMLNKVEEGEMDIQEVNADDIQIDLKVGSSPSRDAPDDATSIHEEDKTKSAKKSRRRSSKSFKPVQLDADYPTEIPVESLQEDNMSQKSDVAANKGKARKRTTTKRKKSSSDSEVGDIELVSDDTARDFPQHVTKSISPNKGDFLEDMFDEFSEVNTPSHLDKTEELHLPFGTSDIDKIIEGDARSKGSESSEESGPVYEDVPLDDIKDENEEELNCRDEKGTDGEIGSKNKAEMNAQLDISVDSLNEELDDDFEHSTVSVQERTKSKRATSLRKKKNPVSTQSDGEERKSRRLSARPKVNYAEMLDTDIKNKTEENCKSNLENSDLSAEAERPKRRRSIHKSQPAPKPEVTEEEKPKRTRKKKDSVTTDEDVEQLYISRGKTISDPNVNPTDLLETIFESPVSKPSGTPILLSKRRYHRSQTFPEKPWRPRPGKRKKRKRGPGGRFHKMANVDEEEITAHLDEVLANLSELSPVAESPKKVMTPYPRQRGQSRI